jgi:hypothetical protein
MQLGSYEILMVLYLQVLPLLLTYQPIFREAIFYGTFNMSMNHIWGFAISQKKSYRLPNFELPGAYVIRSVQERWLQDNRAAAKVVAVCGDRAIALLGTYGYSHTYIICK